MAMLEKAAGLPKMRHLPTAGGGPAITALLGNNAQASTQTVLASLQHVKAGKLRPLASFGAERSKALPDVPTLKERGYDLVYYLWVGLFVPKGTPAAIVSTLGGAIDKAAASPQFEHRDRQYRSRAGLSGRGGFCEILGRGRQALRRRRAPIGKVDRVTAQTRRRRRS